MTLKTHRCIFRSGSEEETFVFPQSNEAEHDKGSTPWENNAGDSTLSDRSTQTDPGVWTPQRRDRKGNNHNTFLYGSPDRKVRPTSLDFPAVFPPL